MTDPESACSHKERSCFWNQKASEMGRDSCDDVRQQTQWTGGEEHSSQSYSDVVLPETSGDLSGLLISGQNLKAILALLNSM